MTLTTDIESVSGDTLEANQTWSFRTRDRAWADTPVLIEVDDAGDASNPQMAVDPSGPLNAAERRPCGAGVVQHTQAHDEVEPGVQWCLQQIAVLESHAVV